MKTIVMLGVLCVLLFSGGCGKQTGKEYATKEEVVKLRQDVNHVSVESKETFEYAQRVNNKLKEKSGDLKRLKTDFETHKTAVAGYKKTFGEKLDQLRNDVNGHKTTLEGIADWRKTTDSNISDLKKKPAPVPSALASLAEKVPPPPSVFEEKKPINRFVVTDRIDGFMVQDTQGGHCYCWTKCNGRRYLWVSMRVAGCRCSQPCFRWYACKYGEGSYITLPTSQVVFLPGFPVIR